MTELLLFPDIETTGLEDDDYVLEIAWAITDAKFTQLMPTRTFIVEHQDNWNDVWARLRGNEIVSKMHHESGLVADLKARPAYEWEDIMHALATDLADVVGQHYGDYAVPVTPAGMSVEFDMARIFSSKLIHQKDTDELSLGWFFHHSLFNLSSLRIERELAGLETLTVTNSKPHRAAYDVLEGIERAKRHVSELRGLDRYRKNVGLSA